MRHPKIIIAGLGVALAVAGGAYGAVAASSAAGRTPPAASSPSGRIPPAATAPAGTSGPATVHIANALVVGKTEAILTTATGLPLYYYAADTAGTSLVAGQLAALWPPLTSAAPTPAGLSGKLTVIHDTHGSQIAYNGHPLYTFAYDRPGQVNGQDFQNFFVVTPGIAPVATSPASPGTAPAAPPSGGYVVS